MLMLYYVKNSNLASIVAAQEAESAEERVHGKSITVTE